MLLRPSFFSEQIVHTFLAARFRKIAHRYQQSYEAIEDLLHGADGPPDFGKKHDKLIFRAQLFDLRCSCGAPSTGDFLTGVRL